MQLAVRPRFTHVGINVMDIDRMADFYKRTLGLMETDRGRGITVPTELVFLSSDSEHHHQFVLSAGRRSQDRTTISQLSFLVPTLDALRATYIHVRDSGVADLRTVTHGNAWSIYFHDPEGNTIEIYTPAPWYVSQPHAGRLDLMRSNDEILQATEAGCRGDPKFMPIAEWRSRFQEALAEEGRQPDEE